MATAQSGAALQCDAHIGTALGCLGHEAHGVWLKKTIAPAAGSNETTLLALQPALLVYNGNI